MIHRMPKPKSQNPGPTELYILAAGLLLGILLGPAVLGRVAPKAQASLFGGGPATQQIIEFEEETASMVAALQATGVTPDAVDEQLEMRDLQGQAIYQARAALMDRTALMRMLCVFVLLGGLMTLEAALSRGGPGWRVARYAVAGLGFALIIARPSLLAAIPSAFGV